MSETPQLDFNIPLSLNLRDVNADLRKRGTLERALHFFEESSEFTVELCHYLRSDREHDLHRLCEELTDTALLLTLLTADIISHGGNDILNEEMERKKEKWRDFLYR